MSGEQNKEVRETIEDISGFTFTNTIPSLPEDLFEEPPTIEITEHVCIISVCVHAHVYCSVRI